LRAQWSPLLPGTFAASSLDGRLKVFGISDPQSGKPLAPGAAPFDPPSWLSRPHAASFGFGGKLVHVHPDVDGSLSRVTIHRVRCDEEWAARSREVANLVKAQDVGAIIDAKLAVAPAAAASADAGAAVPFWPLMRAYVDGNWNDILALLGADEAQWKKDVDAGLTPASVKAPEAAPTADAAEAEPAVESPAADARSASLFGPTASDEVNFMDLATASPTTSGGASVPIDSDLPDFAGLFGDLRVSAGADGVLAKAVLLGRFAEAAEHCLRTGRVGDALLLAACGGRELLARTQLRALRAHANPFMGVLAVFMGSAWEDLVEHCSVAQWKECLQLLVARVRVADAVRFSGLARQLGDRLSAEARPADAVTCYLCAGDLAKSVDAWSAAEGASASPRASLLDAVCRIFVFRSAQSRLELPASAAERIRQQAEQLVSEGELETALVFLDELARAGYTDDQVKLLVHRAKRASAPTVVAAAPQAAAAAGGRAGPALSASAAQGRARAFHGRRRRAAAADRHTAPRLLCLLQ
jgi:protein transport protein SEC31